ncbi:MAG: sigma-70 family RNA polymerase sigma factor [Blautia sp.]|nr:sigma-70 family RNA polymerase sigma factor [Blautia sp.]
MDKETLRQYRALKREIAMLEESIEKLQEQLNEVPVVKGKVQSSMKDFPYVRTHVTVEQSDPVEAERILKRIRIKKARKKAAEEQLLRIEQYIQSIPDSTDRLIFDLVFIQGKTYRDVGVLLNMEFSNVGKRINRKLSTKN